MKNQFIYGLCLSLVLFPFTTKAYVPTNDELRSSVYDYIGDQSQRQQQQDILDKQEQIYKQLFDTYYSTNSSLDTELNYKLKELEFKQEAEERAKAWLKEKALLDKELELIQKEKELDAQKKALQKPEDTDDLVEYMRKATKEIERQRIEKDTTVTNNRIKPPRDTNTIKPFQYETKTNSEQLLATEDIKPIEEVVPKKNIFKRMWSRIMSLF